MLKSSHSIDLDQHHLALLVFAFPRNLSITCRLYFAIVPTVFWRRNFFLVSVGYPVEPFPFEPIYHLHLHSVLLEALSCLLFLLTGDFPLGVLPILFPFWQNSGAFLSSFDTESCLLLQISIHFQASYFPVDKWPIALSILLEQLVLKASRIRGHHRQHQANGFANFAIVLPVLRT